MVVFLLSFLSKNKAGNLERFPASFPAYWLLFGFVFMIQFSFG
jgi:hypothetical protein